MLKAYAEKARITYVDYYSALDNGNGGLPENIAKDGYKIMEAIILPYLK